MPDLDFDNLAEAIKAIAKSTGEKEFVVVGSASIIGSVAHPPRSLVNTIDIDIFPLHGQTSFDMKAVDDQIGAESEFRVKHGFYVERVGDWTVMDQPSGWKDRATNIEIDGIIALCLHPLDLAYNKLNAGRDKDIRFVTQMLQEDVISMEDFEYFVRAGSPQFRLDENLQRLECIRQQIQGFTP